MRGKEWKSNEMMSERNVMEEIWKKGKREEEKNERDDKKGIMAKQDKKVREMETKEKEKNDEERTWKRGKNAIRGKRNEER